VLLGAVVADCVPEFDEDQAEALDRLVKTARPGLTVPRIALRYRLQTDTHGLERSRHRIVAPDIVTGRTRPLLELDRHGRAAPQVIGSIMAAAELPPAGRKIAFRAIDAAIARPGWLPEGLDVVRRFDALPGARPVLPGMPGPASEEDWTGVPTDRRWAMEVLGIQPGRTFDRDDVQRRFRRLVRLAHPDHGADAAGAGERLSELAEAREVLLVTIASAEERPAG
jgi:hypothetical protein